MLPLALPVVNGVTITHAELRALHQLRLEAIRDSTARYCLEGARLLQHQAGESCTIEAYRRDRSGSLLAAVVVSLPHHGQLYRRRVRLVNPATLDVKLKVAVARHERESHT